MERRGVTVELAVCLIDKISRRSNFDCDCTSDLTYTMFLIHKCAVDRP